MADEEHARLLKEGVAGWNNRRGGSLKLIPDLIEADLHRMVPIIQEGSSPSSIFSDLANTYDWVLKPVINYSSQEQ